MALSEAKKAADKRHTAKLDQIMIRPYKEHGAVIRSAAKAHNMSLQAYILEAVQMRMDREAREPAGQPVVFAGQTPMQPIPAETAEHPPIPPEPDRAPEPLSVQPEPEAVPGPVRQEPQTESEPLFHQTGSRIIHSSDLTISSLSLPIENRFPLERLGTEVLKLDREECGREILRLERVISGVDLMMLFCNMTAAERAEWKQRRTDAYKREGKLMADAENALPPENDLPI